jgi:hypothetical protein
MSIPAGSSSHVYVPVPVDKLEKVFQFLAGLDIGEPERTDLEPLVRRVYRESDDLFRDLLHLLAERAEQPLSTEKVAKELGLGRGTASLAGMLGAFGRRSNNRYEGYWPFERLYNPSAEESELVMSRAVADQVRVLD